MKIVVVGPGAMGCLLAGMLAKSGNMVWLLDKNEKRAENIRNNGINIEGKTQLHIKVNITTNATDIGKADLIIIAVKSYDTIPASERLSAIADGSVYILTLQNGVGNVENIKRVLNNPNVLGGVTSYGATLLGDGVVRHAGTGDTYVGRLDGKLTNEIQRIAEAFGNAGIITKVSDNIEGLLWSKLIINVGINALTAITHLNNGRLVEFEGTRDIMEKAVNEAVLVAQKKGIKLIYDRPFEKVKEVCALTSANISSMLQDVLKKRKTEIDYINGIIAEEARTFNIPVPINEALTGLVKTIESSYDKFLFSTN
jgi:2-dehydropantoate 2-reductase